ncbi:MAG: PAS domain S-box protein, partial [Desulfobacterales bacterium]|nr:PAS domain S-box protein [Desulfobacterales bacterium]
MSDAMHPVGANAPSAFSNPEELHRVLFEQATDGIFIADPQLRFLDVNPRGSELIGYSSAELRGMRITDLIPPQDLVEDPLRVDDLRQGRIVTRERRFHRKDGGLLTMEVSVRMLAGGNLLGIVRDITARREAECLLRESETAYRALFKANPHPMYIYDLETLAMLDVNDAALTHYGFSRDEFLGMTIADIRPAEDLPRLLENLAHIGKPQLDLGGLWRHRKKDGTIIEVEIIGHVMDYFGRRAELILANDVTERRRVEKELRESEERMRLSLAASHQGLFDLNVQTGEATVSAEYALMLGYDPAEFHETDAAWIERLHPEDREAAVATYRDYLAGRIPAYQAEFRQLAKSGAWKWILSLGEIVERDARGAPLRMLG